MKDENCIRDVMRDCTVQLFHEYVQLWVIIDDLNLDGTDIQRKTKFSGFILGPEYPAGSAYGMQFDGGLNSLFAWKVWMVWARPKCKFFLWLLVPLFFLKLMAVSSEQGMDRKQAIATRMAEPVLLSSN